MPRLGCMRRSRSCKCSVAGVWSYIPVTILTMVSGASACRIMSVIIERGTEGKAFATFRGATWASALCRSLTS